MPAPHPSRFFSLATAALALVAAAAQASVFAPAANAQVGPLPVVRYSPEGDRQLVFVNNPERREVGFTDSVPGSLTFGRTFSDLADSTLGNKVILEQPLAPGQYRDLFEHVYNLARATSPAAAQNPIHYGVYLHNTGENTIYVTLRGKAFRTGTQGAQPLAELLNDEEANPGGTVYKVPKDHFLWLLRTDVDFDGTRAINPGSFFSGVVDFDVSGGPCTLYNLVYQDYFDVTGGPSVVTPQPVMNFPNLGRAKDMGFIWRRYNVTAAPESRVYKGLMSYPTVPGSGSGVTTSVSYTVDDSVPAGELRAAYPVYTNIGNSQWAPSATTFTGNGWWTHNVPLRDTATIKVVSNDMFDITTPGYGTLYALFQSNAPNTPFGQSNFGNWGVIYRDSVTVTNSGGRDRTFALRLNNSSGGGSPIAYRDESGVWQYTLVRATPVTYYTFTVPAGQAVTAHGLFTLGCPGVGTLRHAVVATN